MRSADNVFHIAVPARDLGETEHFYNRLLGCQLARRYPDRLTFNFFGDQLVCHYSPGEPVSEAKLYPRHFAITFLPSEQFEALFRLIEIMKIPVFAAVKLRFECT